MIKPIRSRALPASSFKVLICIWLGLSWVRPMSGQPLVPADSLVHWLNQNSDLHFSLSTAVSKTWSLPLMSPAQIVRMDSLRSHLQRFELSYDQFGDNVVVRPSRTYVVQGYVRDEQSGEGLVGALIKLGRHQTLTNEDGLFQVSCTEGVQSLSCWYLGSGLNNQQIFLQRDTIIHLQVTAELDLPMVTVAGNQPGSDESLLGTDHTHQLPLSKVSEFPAAGSSIDLVRFLQSQGGVGIGAGVGGGLHVRGGSADQNLFLIDQIPIYNPFHMLGHLSIIHGDMVQHADFSKGAIDPAYGGRLSSVLNVRLKDGHARQLRGNVSMGLINGLLMLEGPLGTKGSFMFGGTHSMPNHPLNLDETYEGGTSSSDFTYGDFFVKTGVDVGKRNTLWLTGMISNDRLEEEDDYEPDSAYLGQRWRDRYRWGNQALGLRWNHIFPSNLYMNTMIYQSRFHYESRNIFGEYDQSGAGPVFDYLDRTDFRSLVNHLGLRWDLTGITRHGAAWKIGTETNLVNYTPGVLAYQDEAFAGADFTKLLASDLEDQLFDTLAFKSREMVAYASYERHFGVVFLKFGLRLSHLHTTSKDFAFLHPRVRLIWAYSPTLSLSASLGSSQQNQHTLTTSDNGYPNELLVPASNSRPPQRAWIADLTQRWRINTNNHLSVGGFYKLFDHLLTFSQNPNFLNYGRLGGLDASLWEEDVVSGDGKAYGIEVQHVLKSDRLTNQFSYHWMRSDRFFGTLFSDFIIPYQFERPHQISMIGSLHLYQGLHLGWNLHLASANVIALAPGSYEVYDEEGYHLSDEAVDPDDLTLWPLRPFQRLDLSLSWKFGGSKAEHQFKLGLLNALNRVNTVSATLDFYEDEPNWVFLNPALHRIPTFSYRLTIGPG